MPAEFFWFLAFMVVVILMAAGLATWAAQPEYARAIGTPGEPVALPEKLVEAANPDARKVAAAIVRTAHEKWEIEGDHCHYHGSPKMSFTYPANYYVGRSPGLFMGARDSDIRQGEAVVRGSANEALIMAAINVIRKRKSDAKEAREKRLAAIAQRAREAKLRSFMDKVEGRQ